MKRKRTALWIVACSIFLLCSEPANAGDGKTAGPAEWIGDLTAIGIADWSYDRAAHLIERAGFGGTPEEIEKLAAMTPREAVEYLVDYESIDSSYLPPFDHSGLYDILGSGPIELELADAGRNLRRHGQALGFKLADGASARGGRQTGGAMGMSPNIMGTLGQRAYFHVAGERMEMYRVERWWAERMLTTPRPLEEKMTFFWHGHFATSDRKIFDYRKMLVQWEMLRENATGNFGDLLHGIAKDPGMIVYLDNGKNVKGDPNENFAREVMELFSMGVGNYTEQDIREAARAFTGWSVNPLDELEFVVNADLHDDGEKTVFGHKGDFGGDAVIDLIIEQPAVERFISAKIYRFFVRENLSSELHEALAAQLREENLELKPFLKTIFLSRDFYSRASYATQVKSPIQLVISSYKKLGVGEIPAFPDFRRVTFALGQELGSPPNVAGWTSGRTWINPATLLERGAFAREVLFPDPDKAEVEVGGTMGASSSEVTPELAALFDNTERVWIHTYSFEYLTTHAGMMAKTTQYNATEEGNQSRAARTQGSGGLYPNIWEGNRQAREFIKQDPLSIARVDMVGMIKGAGARDVEEIVDYLTRRFLRTGLDETRRAPIVAYFTRLIGGDTLDLNVPYDRAEVETNLRKVLYMIMSLAEYQLA